MRKIKAVYLSSTLSWPGISTDLGAVLNPGDPHSKIKGADLKCVDNGLEILFRDKLGFIPHTNIKLIEFYPESSKGATPLNVA